MAGGSRCGLVLQCDGGYGFSGRVAVASLLGRRGER